MPSIEENIEKNELIHIQRLQLLSWGIFEENEIGKAVGPVDLQIECGST